MSGNIKNIFSFYAVGIGLPFVIYFCISVCGAEFLNIFSGSDVIYFNWRALPILTSIPIMVYFEIMFISCCFTKDRKAHPTILKYMLHITAFTIFTFFPAVFAGPLINIGFGFSSYHSCPVGGAFSGVYYVKDKSKCFEITGVKPWGKRDDPNTKKLQ
ncbi:DUF1240 domain-containing protein [Rahnella inusitata]|uniref:DUF1240 domain-containing protein n=1 Tax=Rahnella inusitata TaxID=58169 RepID=UPI0039B0ED14